MTPSTRSAAVFGEVVHHADRRSDLGPEQLAAELAERGFPAVGVERIPAGIEDVFIDLARSAADG